VTVRNVFCRVFYRFHVGRKAMSYKVAGIDVHKKMVVVAEVAASQPEWSLQRRRLGTTSGELRQLTGWLREQGVEEAVMGIHRAVLEGGVVRVGTVCVFAVGAGVFQAGAARSQTPLPRRRTPGAAAGGQRADL
jgi:hypothetical protein